MKYTFFANVKKCFDKLWLKDCLIEISYLVYNPDTIISLYEINKISNILVETSVGKTSNITVEEIVKYGTIFSHIRRKSKRRNGTRNRHLQVPTILAILFWHFLII